MFATNSTLQNAPENSRGERTHTPEGTVFCICGKFSGCSHVCLKKKKIFFFSQKTFYWVTVTFQEKASCLCCGFLGYPLETHLTQFFQKLKNISYKACIGGNPIFLVETNRTSIKKRQRSLIRKWYQELISREWRLQIIILLSFFLIYLYFKFFCIKTKHKNLNWLIEE